MMQTMRNSAKIIFFLVLVTFAGFMILQGLTSIFSSPTRNGKTAPPGVIGEVDGTPIPVQFFENAYRPRFRELLQKEEEPSDEELQSIRDEIWNNLVTLTLMENEAAKRGITVTDAEIVEYMRLSPPQDLQGLEDFRTDGKFDMQKYQTWLRQAAASNDPQMMAFLNDFENRIRQQLIISRLRDLIVSMIRYSPDDVKYEYVQKNEKVQVRYIFIPSSDIPDSSIVVTDQDLREKYEADKDKYEEKAKATFSFVEFPKVPSDADYDAVKPSIDSIRAQITAGADFAKLAEQRSEDPGSGKNGGDLGWFGEGTMVEPFWVATTSLKKIGDISEPFKTMYGWHIVKLTGKREAKPDSVSNETKYEYQASHILLRVNASPETVAALGEKAKDFQQAAIEKGFKEAADEYGLEIKEPELFTRNSYIPNIGQNQTLSDFAFDGKSNDISDVTDTRNGLIVCGLPRQVASRIPPFDEVMDRVSKSYLYTKKIDMAYDRLAELAKGYSEGKTFKEISDESGKQIQETPLFARHEFVPKVGSDPDFIGTAFKLTKERPNSGAVKGRGGAYLLNLVERQEPDMTFYESHADSLYQDTISKKRSDLWPRYVNNLRTEAKIEDYRSLYYGG